jgi:hypothetical protein
VDVAAVSVAWTGVVAPSSEVAAALSASDTSSRSSSHEALLGVSFDCTKAGTTPPPILDQNIRSRSLTHSSQADLFLFSPPSPPSQSPSLSVRKKPKKSQVALTRLRQRSHTGHLCAVSASDTLKTWERLAISSPRASPHIAHGIWRAFMRDGIGSTMMDPSAMALRIVRRDIQEIPGARSNRRVGSISSVRALL